MTKYTDARIGLSISGANVRDATDIHVTLKQGDTLIDITEVEISENSLFVNLTQEQTKLFSVSSPYGAKIEIQVNMFVAGKRIATNIAKVNALENLLEVVLP